MQGTFSTSMMEETKKLQVYQNLFKEFIIALNQALEKSDKLFFQLFSDVVFDAKLTEDLDYQSANSHLRYEKQCITLNNLMVTIEEELGLKFEDSTVKSILMFVGVTYRKR